MTIASRELSPLLPSHPTPLRTLRTAHAMPPVNSMEIFELYAHEIGLTKQALYRAYQPLKATLAQGVACGVCHQYPGPASALPARLRAVGSACLLACLCV
jgi:hypothetical protein